LLRGFLAAIAATLACIVLADLYVAASIVGQTNLIRWPYDETWWKVTICAPAEVISFWAFSRPKRSI
jgi:hypothetical protein